MFSSIRKRRGEIGKTRHKPVTPWGCPVEACSRIASEKTVLFFSSLFQGSTNEPITEVNTLGNHAFDRL